MAGASEIPAGGTATDGGGVAALENVPPQNAGGADALGLDAAALAAAHGGQPAEVTPETRKLRERIRKWKQRHPGQTHPEEHLLPPVGARPSFASRPKVRRDPPPIPAMAASATSPGAAAGSAPAAAVAGEADPEIAAVLAWTDEDVAEITDELIPGLEDWDKLDSARHARLLRLSEKFIKQVEADATMPRLTKKLLTKFLPKLVARKLNEARIDPVKSDGALCTVALVIYAWDKFTRHRDIAKEGKLAAAVTDQVKSN